MRKTSLIISLTAAIAAGACTAADEGVDVPTDEAVTMTELAGSEWTWPKHEGPFVRFEANGRVAGSGGCNNFFGQYSLDPANQKISIGPLAATKKACPGPAMQIETDFFQALDDAAGYDATHLKLVFSDAEGNTVIELNRSDWD